MKAVCLKVGGMTCGACAASVRVAIQQREATAKVDVNVLLNQATVIGTLDTREYIRAVEDAGFQCRLEEDEMKLEGNMDRELDGELNTWCRRLAVCVLFGVPEIILCMVIMPYGRVGERTMRWLMQSEVVLVSIVQWSVGLQYVKKALKSLRMGVLTMDLLVALASLVCYASTMLSNFAWNYLECASTLLLFVTLGKYLECVAKKRTRRYLCALGQGMHRASEASVLASDGSSHQVLVNELAVGDVVLIRPGEYVPADGVVVKGASTTEEALLTGEPRPVYKHSGSMVFAGSLNNGAGVLQAQVTQRAHDSTLAHIVRVVKGTAGARKVRLQRIADRAARVFIPFVLVASLATYASWTVLIYLGLSARSYGEALGFAIAVLTIACPCALGLAVPTALLVGKGVGAKHGLLVRDDESLLDAIKHPRLLLLFDKTGTLTRGILKVERFVLCALPHQEDYDSVDNGGTRQRVLEDVFRLEQHCSEHVIAKSLCEYIRPPSENPPLANVRVHPGRGIEGTVDTRHYLVGSLALMEHIEVGEEVRTQLHGLEQCGMLCVLVSCNGHLVGYFALSDELKSDAQAVVRRLLAQGYAVEMLTGDSWAAARSVAEDLCIGRVYAGCSPINKQDLVSRKQADSGCALVFVGDGINDGPALAQADLGIALGCKASAVAQSAASVVCLGTEVGRVEDVLQLARRMRRTIVGSFAWSVGYNLLALPLAAGCFARWGWRISPGVSGLLMALSSVSVVLNALTLNLWKPAASGANDCTNRMKMAEGECLV